MCRFRILIYSLDRTVQEALILSKSCLEVWVTRGKRAYRLQLWINVLLRYSTSCTGWDVQEMASFILRGNSNLRFLILQGKIRLLALTWILVGKSMDLNESKPSRLLMNVFQISLKQPVVERTWKQNSNHNWSDELKIWDFIRLDDEPSFKLEGFPSSISNDLLFAAHVSNPSGWCHISTCNTHSLNPRLLIRTIRTHIIKSVL